MRLSAAAELAIRGVLVLADRYGKGPVTLDAVCVQRELPKQYLTKIFASLTRNGIVQPVRGKGGGYMLGRPPQNISLLDVVEAVEGPIAMNFCQTVPCQCDEVDCLIRPVWTDVQKTLKIKLGSVKISQCVKQS